MQYKNKKNLHKILFITILLGFIISLVGCNWLSLGLLNIFDPQAQIRVNYTEINIGAGSITLEVFSLNEVEFIGSGFSYDYYVGTTKIPELSKTVGATFYVAPSTSPGEPGTITTIDNLPIYFKEVQDYLNSNPLITEITCTINLIGTDGTGNSITIPVTFDLPALQSGVPSAMTLQAAPTTVTDATGSSTITATVKDADGIPVADRTAVTFSSTYGTLSLTYTTTTDGIATTTLTFGAGDSSSTVTATSGTVSATVGVTYYIASSPFITIFADDYSPTALAPTTITAVVTAADGTPVADNTVVIFVTTKGTFGIAGTTVLTVQVVTSVGAATADLILETSGDIAKVTATCGTRVSNEITITCE